MRPTVGPPAINWCSHERENLDPEHASGRTPWGMALERGLAQTSPSQNPGWAACWHLDSALPTSSTVRPYIPAGSGTAFVVMCSGSPSNRIPWVSNLPRVTHRMSLVHTWTLVSEPGAWTPFSTTLYSPMGSEQRVSPWGEARGSMEWLLVWLVMLLVK